MNGAQIALREPRAPSFLGRGVCRMPAACKAGDGTDFREHGIILRFLGGEHSGLLWEADVLMVFFWRRLRYFILTLVLLAALQGAALAAPQLSGVRFHSEAARDRVVLDLSEASDYELRPAPNISELRRESCGRPRPIAQQMKEAVALTEANRGNPAPKKKAPDRGDR